MRLAGDVRGLGVRGAYCGPGRGRAALGDFDFDSALNAVKEIVGIGTKVVGSAADAYAKGKTGSAQPSTNTSPPIGTVYVGAPPAASADNTLLYIAGGVGVLALLGAVYVSRR